MNDSRSSETPQDGGVVLSVRHLTTQLRLSSGLATVVDDLSFDLKKGQTLALVGESGCGKSLTALSLMRLVPQPPALRPQGQVLFRNQNLLNLSEKELRLLRGKHLAMIFQDSMSALNPVYSIGSQLLEVVELHLGLWGEEAIDRVLAALTEVGIPSPSRLLGDYPHRLSGGMKQRVVIAMAMLCQPAVLIADEPTTALDVTVQAQVLDLIRALQKKHGTSVLLITHDMGVVAEMADEVMVMYAGQAIECGPVQQLFNAPLHPYTRGLFSSRPVSGEKLKPIPGHVPPPGAYPAGCRFHPRCSVALPHCSTRAASLSSPEVCRQVRCWLHDKEGVSE